MAFLEVKDVEAYYGQARALNGITFSMEKGECVGIIGPNGAGKSTLLSSIVGLVNWQGHIVFDGVDTHKLSPTKIVRLKVGYSAQDEIDKNLETVFELFPILKARQKQEAGTLSGGERQMLSLARVFMSSPKLMLLDEPTLGLAPIVIGHISKAIEDLKSMGFTVLIAEQNALFTLKHSERIYLLERGRFTMEGTPQELQEEEYIRQTYFGV